MMTSADVLRVIDLLASVGVDIWLDGGWGVDALLGEQTRPHNDLDIVLKHDDVTRFMKTMKRAGFRPVEVGTSFNFVLADRAGHEVDVHVVDLGSARSDGRGVEVYGPKGQEYEVGSLDRSGAVAGRKVACCAAEFQMRWHSGFELGEKQVQDVMALRARFDLPLPAWFDSNDT